MDIAWYVAKKTDHCEGYQRWSASSGNRRLEVRGHGDRPTLPLDIHPGLRAGNTGDVHTALVSKLQQANYR